MHRLTGRTGAIVGGVLAAGLLFASISAGLRVAPLTRLDPFARRPSLDYRALAFGEFTPLRSDFIASELGSVIGTPGRSAPASGQSEVSSATPPLGSRPPTPVIVDHPFTNDALASAYRVSSVPFTAKTNTASAGRESGEPTGCSAVGGTAWYTYRAPRSLGLIADTFGSRYATALGVFSGTGRGNLKRLGCHTDARGFSRVAFAAKRGVTYWFQIAGPVGGGPLTFNLTRQGVTTRTTMSTQGTQADSHGRQPAISADGRFVTFYSGATTLTPDTPPPPPCLPAGSPERCRPGIFVRDRLAHRVSRADYTPADDVSYMTSAPSYPVGDVSSSGAMSADGRYISFSSTNARLVPGDTNDNWDVFVHDRQTGKVRRVSVSSGGAQSDGASFTPSISADGRYVAFTSTADDLVEGDANLTSDVFVHDILARKTIRASVATDGREGDNARPGSFPAEAGSFQVSMSASGRYILFRSAASNLVTHDTNEVSDYFVRDLKTRTTERVSVSSAEGQANADSRQPIGIVQWAVSDDGRYVVFNSSASNLVADDTNGAEDIFVRDRRTGATRRVSVSSSGGEADLGVGNRDTAATYAVATSALFVIPVNGTDLSYSATPNGRYVAFGSDATNLVSGDTNDTTDVFLRDMLARTTGRVSVSSTGAEGDGPSNQPVLSADGRFVAFESAAQNLVAGDSNASEDIFVHEVPRGEAVSGLF